MSKRRLVSQYRKWYTPQNTVYVVVGNIDIENAIEIFSSLLPSKNDSLHDIQNCYCFKEENIFVEKPEATIGNCIFAYLCNPMSIPDNYILQLAISCIELILFNEMRYENNYVYAFKCDSKFTSCGTEVYFEFSTEKIKECYNKTIEIVEYYKNHYIPDNVIEGCKKHFILKEIMKTDIPTLSNLYGNQMLLQLGHHDPRLYTPTDLKRIITKVTKENIQNTIRERLVHKKFIYQYHTEVNI